jgi:hypothetical protein
MAVIDPSKPTTGRIGTADADSPQAKKRRSSRVAISIEVTVFAQSPDHRVFGEITKTASVSAHGALITMKTDVDPQKPVLMVNKKTGAESQCHVSHRKEIEDNQLEIGLEFVTPLPKFWGINFPPEDWDPADRKRPGSTNRPFSPLLKGLKR